MLTSRRFGDSRRHRAARSMALARNGMVCTSQPLASSAALATLRAGGNAIDAAVTAAAMLNVVEPYNTGVGGDCFLLIWSAREGRLHALDGCGRSPATATIEELARRGVAEMPAQGIFTVTVPGAVDAWATALARFGSRSLADALAPAVACAEEGFPVSELVSYEWRLAVAFDFLKNDEARRVLGCGGAGPQVGEIVRRPELATTLRGIAAGGRDAFYRGEVAERLVELSRSLGGLLELADLAEHESRWVEPISAEYRGCRLYEMPPSTQGLTALLALGMLAHFDLADLEPDSPEALHLRIEAVKLAFADRNAYIADPESAEVPIARLLDPEYTRRRAGQIDPGRALPLALPGLDRGGSDTVYLTTADSEGNVVSLINSLYGAFGSGLMVPGTGVVLQNRGRGFRLDPSHPSALAPRKRPFHTLCPAMLFRDDRPLVSFGVMGGDVQAQAHVQVVSNLLDFGANVQEALDWPRFHYLDGARVAVEEEVSESTREGLAALGHHLEGPLVALARGGFGGGQAIQIDRAERVYAGGSDRRKDGCAIGY
jgi:gamma-glutamyltranspeptidase / glutathione hydrolase